MRSDSRELTYTVFARRYRPIQFTEVVGQEHVAQTLKNAIRDGRVGHAYLFAGPRGVGKTSMARLFAKALNCVKGPTETPCNACEICLTIQDGSDTDVIEMDAASNRGVDDARALRDGVRYAPLRARSKIYIIDEAHMLTREAFNTLLKTLEEPPPHVKFVFATTEIHKLPDTITSRCQRFDFRRITSADIVKRLAQVAEQEKISVSAEVLECVARAGRGSMRDAESILDQLVSFKQKGLAPDDVAALLGAAGDVSLAELVAAIKAGAADRVLVALDKIFSGGIDAAAFADQTIDHFRTLLVVSACGAKSEIVDLPDSVRSGAEEQSRGFTVESLLYALQILLEARRRIREGASPRVVLELSLVKMARSADLISLGEIVRGPARAAEPARESRGDPRPSEPSRMTRSSAPPEAGPAPPSAEAGPAAEPDEPEETVGTPSSRSEAQALWPRVVAEVKQQSVLAGALLGEGTVTRLIGDDLEFTLPSKFVKWNVEQLESPKNRAAIEGAVHKVFGKRYGVVFMLEKTGASPRPAGEAPLLARPAASGLPSAGTSGSPTKPGAGGSGPSETPSDLVADPGVKKILDKFGGRIVGIE